MIPLSDGAGEVVETGPGVTRVRAGERVAAIFVQRWLAGRVDPAYASSARGGLTAGEIVLTLGTGGVSLFAAQFARMAGARVIVTSGSEEKIARLKAMDITDVVNYRATPDWERAVLDLTGGQGADHVVELGGAGTLAKSLSAARDRGPRAGSDTVAGTNRCASHAFRADAIAPPTIHRVEFS